MKASDVYRRIYVKMWGDEKVRALSPTLPSAQALWIHLLCGEQTGIIPGLFKIGERAFAEQLGWPLCAAECHERVSERVSPSVAKGFRECFDEVIAQGLVKADWSARLVFVPNAISYNPPANPNVVRHWKSAWGMLPECRLKDESIQVFKPFLKGLGEGFAKAFDEVLGKDARNHPLNYPPIQDTGSRKQEQRESPPALWDGDLLAHTISADSAVALVEHWQKARLRRGEPTKAAVSSMWLHNARAIIAMAGGDLDEAKRVVDAYVDGKNDYWASKKWALSYLAKPRDFEEAFLLVGANNTPARSQAGFDANKYEANLARQIAEIEAENAAEAGGVS